MRYRHVDFNHDCTQAATVLTEQGISATTAQCCLNEIPLNCNGMDLIVTSMRTNSDYGIPTLNGAALLTGINDDALKQQIKALLTQ